MSNGGRREGSRRRERDEIIKIPNRRDFCRLDLSSRFRWLFQKYFLISKEVDTIAIGHHISDTC